MVDFIKQLIELNLVSKFELMESLDNEALYMCEFIQKRHINVF